MPYYKSMMRAFALLLLLILLITGVGVSHADKKLDASAKKGGRLTIEHVEFLYRLDEEARYVDLKTQYQSRTRGKLPEKEAESLALEAFEKASVEKPFTHWRYQGGPDPNVFLIKAHLYNQSSQARLNTNLSATIRAKIGELLVNPKLLLVDFSHLQQTAQWQTIETVQKEVPVMITGEEILVEISRFELLKFLNAHPNQWPTEIEVTVSSPDAANSATETLKLTPDHFSVPVLY